MQNVLQGMKSHASLLLMAVLLAAPVAATTSPGIRSFVMQAVAFTLLVLLLARVKWSAAGLKRFAAAGPNLAVLGFLGWAAFSVVIAPPQGAGLQLALHELLRLTAGTVIYFAVMYRFGSRERQNILVHFLLAGGIVAAASGVVTYLGRQDATGAFGNHQLLAGFLAVLAPVAFAFAIRGEMDLRRVLALVSLVTVSGSLILTQNRSSWLGALIGMAAVGALALTDAGVRANVVRRRLWVAPALLAVVSVGVFFAMAGVGGKTQARLQTLMAVSADRSVQNRMDLLAVAGKMVAEKPVLGQGLGAFQRRAGEYDAQFPAAGRVDRVGATMSTLAHNEYATIAAELGWVGLALYLAVLGAFLVRSVRSLGRIGSETRRWVVIASVGALAAQMVDAIGNPAWQFGEVSPLLWLVLGLGMAASRTHGERAAEGETVRGTVAAPQFTAGRMAWVGVCALVGVALTTGSFANRDSRGRIFYEDPGVLNISPTRVSFGVTGQSRNVSIERIITITNRRNRRVSVVLDVRADREPVFFLRSATDRTFNLAARSSRGVKVHLRRNVLGSHTGCVTIFLDGQRYKIEDRTKSNCGGIDLVGEVVAGNPR